MKEKINEIILNNLIKIDEFENRKVFFVKKEGFEELWDLREKHKKELIENGFNEKMAKRFALKDYLKIINPKKEPVKFINYGLLPAYTLVVDKEKILKKYIDAEFYKWKNRTLKKAKKEMDLINDEVERYKYELMIKNLIDEVEEIYKDIKENPDKYEILYTRYERISKDKLMQPCIYFFTLENGRLKGLHEYLRKEVPNIIYDGEIIKPPKKNTKDIEKRLAKMRNVFGNIYIKK